MSYFDRKVRPRVSSKKYRTGQQGSVTVFSKKGGGIDPRHMGTRRIWDTIAPPMVVKTMKFYPREQGAVAPGNITVTQVMEAAAGQQKLHYFECLSVTEWMTLAGKLRDNHLLDASQETTTQPSLNAYNEQNRQLMLETYKQTFYFENCQTWSCFVELIEIQPKRPIMDFATYTNVLTQFTTSESKSSPLACMYKDYEQNKSFRNNHNPLDSSFNETRAQREVRIGYTLTSNMQTFNRNYRVVNRKVVKVPPGGKIQYDVVIPGFVGHSDFSSEEFSAGLADGSTVTVFPSKWEKTRGLIVRHWSDTVQAAGNVATGMGDTCIKVICDKYIRMRGTPGIGKPTLFAEGTAGIDQFGVMVSTQDMISGIADTNVRFINVESDTLGTGAQSGQGAA
jgi:hypothetical protein